MRVALVTPFFSPVIGGVELHVLELARHLTSRGHRPVVFTANLDHSGEPLPSGLRDAVDGVEVRRYPVRFRLGQFASFWPDFASDLSGFDVAHAHALRHPHVRITLRRAREIGALGVVTSHSPWHEWVRAWWLEVALRAYDFTLLRSDLKLADAVVAVHEGDGRELAARGIAPERIRVIPNGVGMENFRDYSPLAEAETWRTEGGPVALYAGRIHKTKGFDVLLPAFARASIRQRGLTLIIAGPDGGYLTQVRAMVRRLELEGRVLIVGPKHGEELQRLYASCDFFVSVSPYEPFGITYLEAMAHRLPCLAVGRGGPLHIIEHGVTGILCEYTIDSVAAGLLKLCDAPFRMDLAARARQAAERYTWPRVCQQVVDLYEELLGIRRAPEEIQNGPSSRRA